MILGAMGRTKALNMGMPHVDTGECLICGARSFEGRASRHHVTPKGMGGKDKVMRLRSDATGHEYVLESALAYVCGSGTGGCHDRLHGGARYRMSWVFETPEYERAWFSGEMLDAGIQSHSPELYRYGHWEAYEYRRVAGKRQERLVATVYHGQISREAGEWEDAA